MLSLLPTPIPLRHMLENNNTAKARYLCKFMWNDRVANWQLITFLLRIKCPIRLSISIAAMAIRNNDNTFALLLSVQSALSCERPQRHSGECLQLNERRRFRFGCIAAEEVKTQLQFNLNDVNFVVSWPGNGVKSLGAAPPLLKISLSTVEWKTEMPNANQTDTYTVCFTLTSAIIIISRCSRDATRYFTSSPAAK